VFGTTLEHLHWYMDEATSLKARPFLPPSSMVGLFSICSISFNVMQNKDPCLIFLTLVFHVFPCFLSFFCDSVSKVGVAIIAHYRLGGLLYQSHKTCTCFIVFCSTRLHCFPNGFSGKWSHKGWIPEQWNHL